MQYMFAIRSNSRIPWFRLQFLQFLSLCMEPQYLVQLQIYDDIIRHFLLTIATQGGKVVSKEDLSQVVQYDWVYMYMYFQ